MLWGKLNQFVIRKISENEHEMLPDVMRTVLSQTASPKLLFSCLRSVFRLTYTRPPLTSPPYLFNVLTTFPGITWLTDTRVSAHLVHTHRVVVTRIPLTFIRIKFTSWPRKTRPAFTAVSVYSVNTVSIDARTGQAIVDIGLTSSASEPVPA